MGRLVADSERGTSTGAVESMCARLSPSSEEVRQRVERDGS